MSDCEVAMCENAYAQDDRIITGGSVKTGLTFDGLRQANLTRQSEWDRDGKIDLSYRGNELAGEVGEACNVIKKLERERLGIRGSRDTVEHAMDELADVVICVDLLASALGGDLGEAVRRKFNATSEKNGLLTRLEPKP